MANQLAREIMKEPEQKKAYLNTTIPKDLLKSLKILAAHEGVRINHLLKEAIQDLLKKYDKKH